MYRDASGIRQEVERLGELAMPFRGTGRGAERQAIAKDYAQTVERLLRGGSCDEIPAPEDQLPDAWMPQAFFDYGSRRQGA